ncbi:MAG TPA: MBL fold metallo-hydrolase [Terriglobia bacterium]|nr:MBL fold metallo-hydrolase [Terriglobia bacterium]
MKLGCFDLALISDGTFALDGGQIFGVVPKVMWEKKAAADARNRVRMGLNCLLVRTGNETVLIETGIGDKYDAKFADIYNIQRQGTGPATLLDGLRACGVAPEDIDVVINTHLHFDHCGWNVRRAGENRAVPTFPRARYVVQRAEWEHALHPTERDRASYIADFFASAEPQTDFLDGGRQIVPGIRVEVVPGHNRDMQCVWIESDGARACFISDLVPTRLHLAYPWIMSLDLYPLETLANKKRLLPQLVREKTLVVFPHDHEVPWARLTTTGQDGKIAAEQLGDA